MAFHPTNQQQELRRQTRRAQHSRERLGIFWVVFPATIAVVIVVAFVLRLAL